MRTNRIGSSLIVIAALAAAAGCGGGSSGGGSSSSPEGQAKAAASSFISALKAKNATDACKFISFPSDAGVTCAAGMAQLFAAGGLTGNPTVANAVVSGTQALVVTTGKFCLAGTCISNSDSSAGLPSGGTSFSAAYSAAASNDKSPDLSLVKTGSQWLVVLGS
jgi:hypothetical protein